MHFIENFSFQFWHGTRPTRPTRQIVGHAAFAKDGVGQNRGGKIGRQFESQLVGHWPTYVAAVSMIPQYQELIGEAPVKVVWEGIDLETVWEVKYLVDHVELLEARAMPRLIGPGYDFIGGTRLTTRWLLTPTF
jgi:hypothetical protein